MPMPMTMTMTIYSSTDLFAPIMIHAHRHFSTAGAVWVSVMNGVVRHGWLWLVMIGYGWLWLVMVQLLLKNVDYGEVHVGFCCFFPLSIHGKVGPNAIPLGLIFKFEKETKFEFKKLCYLKSKIVIKLM